MNFALRPELAHCGRNIATWDDRYVPPPDEHDERLARYPYLALLIGRLGRCLLATNSSFV